MFYSFHYLWLFHSIFHFCWISDGNIVYPRYKPRSLPRDKDFSYLVYWEPCRRHCIWGVSELDHLSSVGSWEAHTLAGITTANEPAGVSCLCCTLVGAMTEITSQPIGRRYTILFATQNKSTTEQEGDKNLSTNGICATCCGKTHLGTTQCCMKTEFPRHEGMQDLLAFFTLSYWNSYFIKPFDVWPSYWDPERALLLLPHPLSLVQNI